MITAAVTGADGFIGGALCSCLEAAGYAVIRIVRKQKGPGANRRVVADLASSNFLDSALDGADAIFHLAGRAHVLRETDADPAVAYERNNVIATERLVRAACQAGVRRFVFLSSIGVNGNQTDGFAFTESDVPAPVELYARSKLRAEELLKNFCRQTSLELVIVRPPLVYGPGAAGNWQRLVRLAASGWPLSIGSVGNKRSLIGVRNLCDFLVVCAVHPAAVDEVFLVAEPRAYSTCELLSSVSRALGRPDPLLRVPVGILRLLAIAIGKRAMFDKLCGSLEVSSEKARRLLGWAPKVTFEDELRQVAADYERGSGD